MRISTTWVERSNPMPADSTACQGLDSPAPLDWSDAGVRRHLSRLAQVVNSTASAIVITDIHGVTVWVNEGFTRITGYSLAEAVGVTPGRLLQGPNTDRNETSRIAAALGSRRSVAAELINYGKDGRPYWIGMKIEPLRDEQGTIDGFMAIEADITERHQRNRDMELLTRRFNMATRAAHIGVYEREAHGDYVWWSDVMFDIFGQDPAVFHPTRAKWLELIHPDDREGVRAVWNSASESPTSWKLQYRVMLPDGTLRHVQSVGSFIEEPSGLDNRISGMVIDITERVDAERRERQLQEQLRESAHQAGMAEIATGVLHNVGNVINSLGIANSTARRELKTLRIDRLEQATSLLRTNRSALSTFLSDDERGRHLPDYLPALAAQMSLNSSAIHAELETTDKLLHHLSDIVSAQQEFAHVAGRRESTRLNELMETALLVQASDLAQIEIVREYEELPIVMTDRHKLLQILVNLLSNAREAIQAHATPHARIRVNIALDGEHVRLTIEDSGIGMSKEILSQIWRFGFTTKKRGHGFGLHNCANAAREIGATLTAHSDGVGHGACFILRIPLDNHDPMLSGVAA